MYVYKVYRLDMQPLLTNDYKGKWKKKSQSLFACDIDIFSGHNKTYLISVEDYVFYTLQALCKPQNIIFRYNRDKAVNTST